MHYAYILAAQTFTAVSMVIMVYSIEGSIMSHDEAIKHINKVKRIGE